MPESSNPRPALPSAVFAKAVDCRSHQAWLASEVERLDTLIRPAPASVIDEAIDLILEGHGGRRTNETRAKAYCIALEGFSAHAIGLMVKDVLRDQAGVDPNWAPTAPRLAALCRAHETRMRTERDRHDADLRRLVAPQPEPSPEEREKIVTGFEDLSRQLFAGSAQRRLDEAAAKALQGVAQRVRDERVAADLAGRNFPPAPSQIGPPETEPPPDTEPKAEVA